MQPDRVSESTVPPRWKRILPWLLIVVSALAASSSAVAHHRQISIFDEYVYADYLYKVPTQGIVVQGEEIGQDARELITCRGVMFNSPYGGVCRDDGSAPDSTYPYNGKGGADLYTPVYFWSTWAVAQPLASLTGIDLFDAGRLVGGLWLAGGLVASYAFLRALRTGRILATGLVLALGASPAVFWSNSYVTTDAPSVLAGALTGLLGVAIVQGRRSPWWLVAATPLLVATKFQHVLPIALVALWIIFDRWNRQEGSFAARLRALVSGPAVLAAVLAVVAAAVTQGVWLVIRASLAVGSVEIGGLIGNGRGFDDFLAEATRFLPSTVSGSWTMGGARDVIGVVLGWACVVGVLGLLVVGSRVAAGWNASADAGDRPAVAAGPFALAVTAATLLSGPAIAIATYLLQGVDVALPNRYGLSLLPFFFACVALFVGDRRRWAIAIAAFGLVCSLVALVAVPGY